MNLPDVNVAKFQKLTSIVDEAKDRLNRILDKGTENVQTALSNIWNEFDNRQDFIVKPEKLRFNVIEKVDIGFGNGEEHLYSLTHHAEQQLFNKIGVPSQYAKKLIDKNLQWLLVKNLEEMNKKNGEDGYLIRTVGNTVKGILSPSFRRMSSAPVFEAFVNMALALGYAPYKGINTDYRYALDFLFPEVHEIAQGEFIVIGLSITTGDYGNAKLAVELSIFRVWCSNLHVGYSLLSKVHIGKRFEASDTFMELSKETHELDDKTIVSATKDIVQASEKQRGILVNLVKNRMDKPVNIEAFLKDFRKTYSQDLTNALKYAYTTTSDVEQLPKEQNVWRLSNTLSLLAKNQNGDTKLNLERDAMAILLNYNNN